MKAQNLLPEYIFSTLKTALKFEQKIKKKHEKYQYLGNG